MDGLNTVFQLSAPYAPGSVEVFLNGQAKRQDYDDGWSELGSNTIKMKQPPALGDVVQVFYRPA